MPACWLACLADVRRPAHARAVRGPAFDRRRCSRCSATSRSTTRPTAPSTTATPAWSRSPAMSRSGRTTTCCAPTRSRSTATPASPPPTAMSCCSSRTARSLFADYAELTQDMKDGVLRDMRALLAENGRAGGQRRAPHRGAHQRAQPRRLFHLQPLQARIRAAPLLADPRPLGRAGSGQQADRVPGRRGGDVRLPGGVPAVLLAPRSVGEAGERAADAVLRRLETSRRVLARAVLLGHRRPVGCHLHPDDRHRRASARSTCRYRHAFNNGTVTVNGSLGYDENAPQYDLFANGQFAINDQWRWGFDIERASSVDYIRDFHVPNMQRRADQPDLPGGIRPGLLFAARHAGSTRA